MAVERVRSRHPDDPAWRADALAGSRHSRLLDELRLPAENHDPERAERLCAEVARIALVEHAPALILLPPDRRRRAQALAAYALTLFDFAVQSGLEGERLAQLNRWQFNLELALDGRPPGQPVFVLMAAEERRRPWNREALDRLAGAARRAVTRRRPPNFETAVREAEALAAALAEAVAGETADSRLARLGGALVRLRGVQRLGEGLRRRRARLPVDELPEPVDGRIDHQRLAEAVAAECARLRRDLQGAEPGLRSVSSDLRPAATYLRRAGLALLRRIERRGAAIVDRPVTLGIGIRLALLLRSRIGI